MPYLWVLLDGNEDSLGQLDVFIADDVQVFLHVAIFPQFVTFTLFNLWKEKKKTKLGTADERSVVWASKSSDFVAVDIGDSRRVRSQIDPHQKVSILPFHVKDGEELLFLLTPCNFSIKREIFQKQGKAVSKSRTD